MRSKEKYQAHYISATPCKKDGGTKNTNNFNFQFQTEPAFITRDTEQDKKKVGGPRMKIDTDNTTDIRYLLISMIDKCLDFIYFKT